MSDMPPPPPAGDGSAPPPPPPPRPQGSDDGTWIMGAHLGQLVLGFVAPLIVMLTRGNESEEVRWHSVEALNFGITLTIAWFVTFILSFLLVGLLIMPFLLVAQFVLPIMAGVKAGNGERWKYPLTLRLVS